ncbi:MAG: hypothetical protein CK424_03380 [Legionella sp.]|nr:MAG: hypothetical protein CK424_03380 [Legionella sp.]
MVFSSKKISAITVLLIANASFAGVMGEAEFDTYTGYYVGLDVGVSNLINSESTENPLQSHQLSATGIIGGGLVGYDFSLYNRFKIGFEGFMNANGLHIATRSFTPPSNSFTTSSQYNAGLRVLPGFEFSQDTVGHILLGYSNAKFTIQDSGNYGYIDQELNKNGFQCGLGMKTTITKQISIRIDALYTTYGHISSIGGSNTPGFTYQTYHNNFSTVEGDLTLIYKFI